MDRRPALAGCRVLVVEDDYFIGDDLSRMLSGRGAVVVGPFGTLREAMDHAVLDPFEVAVLDIKLSKETAYPLADALRRRNLPFLFATGYTADDLPERFSGVAVFEKPFDEERLVAEVISLCGLRAARSPVPAS